jgi:hypothetical protein
LTSILIVNATLVTQAKNDEIKEGVGVGGNPVRPHPDWDRVRDNFDYMPELHWLGGCPFALWAIRSSGPRMVESSVRVSTEGHL